MTLDRSTGRTYRICLSALLNASQGKNVCIVYGSPQEYAGLWNTLTRLASGYTSYTTVTKRLEIAGGSIDVRSMHSNFHGLTYDSVFIDELVGARWREIQMLLENIATFKLETVK